MTGAPFSDRGVQHIPFPSQSPDSEPGVRWLTRAVHRRALEARDVQEHRNTGLHSLSSSQPLTHTFVVALCANGAAIARPRDCSVGLEAAAPTPHRGCHAVPRRKLCSRVAAVFRISASTPTNGSGAAGCTRSEPDSSGRPSPVVRWSRPRPKTRQDRLVERAPAAHRYAPRKARPGQSSFGRSGLV
jgi:hypothetical protein